jgi:hypothetical protein
MSSSTAERRAKQIKGRRGREKEREKKERKRKGRRYLVAMAVHLRNVEQLAAGVDIFKKAKLTHSEFKKRVALSIFLVTGVIPVSVSSKVSARWEAGL